MSYLFSRTCPGARPGVDGHCRWVSVRRSVAAGGEFAVGLSGGQPTCFGAADVDSEPVPSCPLDPTPHAQTFPYEPVSIVHKVDLADAPPTR